jgi:hypothetical protein
MAGVDNKKAQLILQTIDADIKGAEAQLKNETLDEQIDYVKGMADYQSQQIMQLRYSNAIDKNTINEKIGIVKAELSGMILKNELTKAQTNNTIQLTEESKQRIMQGWTKLVIDTQHLNIEAKKQKVEEFKANLSSEYQGISNVMGKMMNDIIGIGNPKENDELHDTVKY